MNILKYNLILLSVMMLFVSCSDEEANEDINEIETDEFIVKQRGAPDVNTYLEAKYPNGYSFGDEKTFEDGNDSYTVKEIIKTGNTLPDGFVNLRNSSFTHYMELDRVRDQFIVDDFEEQSLYTFDEDTETSMFIDEGFLASSNAPTSTSGGNRFWGWQCGPEYSINPGSCFRNCSYRVFWQETNLEAGEDHPVYSCDNLPGSNPRLND